MIYYSVNQIEYFFMLSRFGDEGDCGEGYEEDIYHLGHLS